MPTKTLPLPRAAELLGISRATAYTAVRDGSFPVPTIRVGKRIVVPTKPLLDLLGLDELPELTAA